VRGGHICRSRHDRIPAGIYTDLASWAFETSKAGGKVIVLSLATVRTDPVQKT
jgi:hypothetical protein